MMPATTRREKSYRRQVGRQVYAPETAEYRIDGADYEEYNMAAEAYDKYLRDGKPASTLEEVSRRLELDD